MRKPELFLVFSFLLIALSFDIRNTTNPFSRLALIFSLQEGLDFRIDSYVDMTVDWSRRPDGAYFSNKAPGPALVAAALFAPFDRFLNCGVKSREGRDQKRRARIETILKPLSFFLQTLPLIFFSSLLTLLFRDLGISQAGRLVFLAAVLFSNTAVLFTNTFFGHSFSHWVGLALMWSLIRNRWEFIGLFFGLGVLSDYSFALLFPVLLIWSRPNVRLDWVRFIVGGLLPGFLWCYYHQQSFGSVFTIANRYQNPRFVDVSVSPVMGMFTWLPNPRHLFELLFGASRGLLFTQPWVLLLLGFRPRSRALPFVVAFCLFLLMNGLFSNWHGGDSPGPRYLSPLFSISAVVLALNFDHYRPSIQSVFRWAMIPGVFIFMLHFSVAEFATEGAALPVFYFSRIINGSHTVLFRICTLIVIAVFAARAFRGTNFVRRHHDS